jgi:hypothetical protein
MITSSDAQKQSNSHFIYQTGLVISRRRLKMSNNVTAVYVYSGPPSTLVSAVRQAAGKMSLITKQENINDSSFSMEASEKMHFISTKWPGKFIIDLAFADGTSTLTVTANLNLVLAPAEQVLRNQAKLNEFMEMIKALAPNIKANNSGIDDLEKLADLRDKGIISPAEFEAKKKQIMGF